MIERIKAVLSAAGLAELPEDINEDLTDYGMDSLMMVLSLGGLEKAFGLRVPAERFTPEAFRSIASIAEFLRSLGAA